MDAEEDLVVEVVEDEVLADVVVEEEEVGVDSLVKKDHQLKC